MNGIQYLVFQLFTRPIPSIRLNAFRVCLGISLLIYFHEQWGHSAEWLTAEGFHASPSVLAAEFGDPHGVPLLPPSFVPWFGLVTYIGLIGMILFPNFWPFTVISFLSTAYFTIADPMSAFTLNSLFTFSLFILVISPIAKISDNRKEAQSLAWPLRILQFTLIALYFFSGWKKAVFGDWLDHSDVLWSQVQGHYRTDLASHLLNALPLWAWTFMQVGALAFELASPIIFMTHKFRFMAIISGIAFHLSIALLMHKLIYFSLQVMSMYMLFVSPTYIVKLIDLAKRFFALRMRCAKIIRLAA